MTLLSLTVSWKNTDGKKILHYLKLYVDLSDPIAFMSVVVNASCRSYIDFLCLLFLHTHRETRTLKLWPKNPTESVAEESDQFRFFSQTGDVLTVTETCRIDA